MEEASEEGESSWIGWYESLLPRSPFFYTPSCFGVKNVKETAFSGYDPRKSCANWAASLAWNSLIELRLPRRRLLSSSWEGDRALLVRISELSAIGDRRMKLFKGGKNRGGNFRIRWILESFRLSVLSLFSFPSSLTPYSFGERELI